MNRLEKTDTQKMNFLQHNKIPHDELSSEYGKRELDSTWLFRNYILL